MEKNKNVRFVRIRGRIVPVKVKPGSGNRKPGKIRAAKSAKAKRITKDRKLGNNLFQFGLLSSFLAPSIASSAKKDAVRSVQTAARAIQGKDQKLANKAVSLFRKQKIKLGVSKVAAFGGIASSVIGGLLSLSHTARADKEGRKRAIRTKALRKQVRNEQR